MMQSLRIPGTRRTPSNLISHAHPEVTDTTPETKVKWVARNLFASLPGRVAMSAYGTTVASVNKANCLSPWGDLSSVLLPNVRVRDVLITAVTATTGLPFSNIVTDTIYESAVEGVMEVEIARAQDMIQGMRRPKEAGTRRLLDVSTATNRDLLTTAVKTMTISVKYNHMMTDAALGFFTSKGGSADRAVSSTSSDTPPSDAEICAKGWLCPYLYTSHRWPAITRNSQPEVVFCHGPWIPGDYIVAQKLLDESTLILDLCPQYSQHPLSDLPTQAQFAPPSPVHGQYAQLSQSGPPSPAQAQYAQQLSHSGPPSPVHPQYAQQLSHSGPPSPQYYSPTTPTGPYAMSPAPHTPHWSPMASPVATPQEPNHSYNAPPPSYDMHYHHSPGASPQQLPRPALPPRSSTTSTGSTSSSGSSFYGPPPSHPHRAPAQMASPMQSPSSSHFLTPHAAGLHHAKSESDLRNAYAYNGAPPHHPSRAHTLGPQQPRMTTGLLSVPHPPPPLRTQTTPTYMQNPEVWQRRMLVVLLGIKPHRGNVWTSSERPEESLMQYQLLDGAPSIVLPMRQGGPLVGWHAMTLQGMHDAWYRDGGGRETSRRTTTSAVDRITGSLFEYVEGCVDWERLDTGGGMSPGVGYNHASQEEEDARRRLAVSRALELLVTAAAQCDSAALRKKVDRSRAGIAFFRLP